MSGPSDNILHTIFGKCTGGFALLVILGETATIWGGLKRDGGQLPEKRETQTVNLGGPMKKASSPKQIRPKGEWGLQKWSASRDATGNGT